MRRPSFGRAVWSLASALDRLPWVCWPDLVTWALPLTHWRKPDHPADAWRRLIPRAARELATILLGREREVSQCKASALECGSCYCGKFQSAEFQRDVVGAGHYKRGILVRQEASR